MDDRERLVAKIAGNAKRLYDDFQTALGEAKDIPWDAGEGRIDDAFDAIDEVLERLGYVA